MRNAVLLLVSLGLFSLPAHAGNRCYGPEEMQAEQILRLHSELMVTTVTCRQGSDGRDLVSAYTGFTRNNIKMLHDAEHTMEVYYKKNYGGNPVDRLDRLRTLLANEYGQKIANMSAPAFCAQERDKVLTLYNSAPASILGEVEKIRVEARSYAPACGQNASASSRKRG